ncbi:rare lipoprotein A (peptidoglycan hydrolase) [Filimonas zeae]|uniref:RlpA-like protein double-psi beta-barrel domain-containing protein n=1 Tax=Filimonas zeae TaxID=1737353 RepID=A0A917MZQ6_9BACT|nr:septal ring lytic transglycosylase RlpA family protein [Filimonas zeae]MDR6342840.1 rare lipoprotein A (peptidoglycan hydrolase) [Filimonas zeae]GGH82907.1 hypothetical protein GCM10011379_57500 [Filimonas zeae]
MKKYLAFAVCLFFTAHIQAQTDSAVAKVGSAKKTSRTDVGDEKVAYGIASFYSKSLEGTKTATGETFRHAKFTAASNHFRLGTWVRVINLRNGKSAIVRINDRMHKKMALRGRVVDLSYAAAEKLSFIKSGIVRVKVVAVPEGTTE